MKTENQRLVPLSVMASDLGILARDLRKGALDGIVPFVRVGESGMLFNREEVHRVLLKRATSVQGNESRRGR